MGLNIKYSPFFHKLFSRINNKTIIVLVISYILFIILQMVLFSLLWQSDSIDLSKDKNSISPYMNKYQNMGFEIEQQIDKYTLKLENIAKEVSIPYHLNWIIDLQKKLKRRVKKDQLNSIFIFNHHGRLLNFAPNIERLRNSNYQFTPYLKKVLKYYRKNRSPFIYYYTDSELIQKRYINKGEKYIERGKNHIIQPFIKKKDLKKADKKAETETITMESLFKKQIFTQSTVPYLMFFTPLFNQHKRVIGFAGFNLDIDKIFKTSLSKNHALFNTIIINQAGIIVYSLNKNLIGHILSENKNIYSITKNKKNIVKLKGNVYLKYPITIDNKSWMMLSKVDPNKLSALLTASPFSNPILYIFFLLEAIIFFSLFYLFNKNVTQPIAKFSIGLKNLSKGDALSHVDINNNDEFKLIGNRFNHLSDRVKGYLIFGKTISHELVDEYLENQMTSYIPTEEKQGTILYLKIKNISNIKQATTTEELDILLNKFFNDIEISVSYYKGFIDNFSSDSILAIFGVPVNEYNHAQNAYECAKKIFKNLKVFNKVNKIPFEISISIHTGDIFYSQMQSNYGRFFVSLGETIKNTLQFESVTNPNVLSLSEETMQILSPKPKMKKMLQLKLKGQQDPSTIYLKAI